MNPQQLQQVQVAAPLIAAGLFVLALLMMLLAVYYFRRSRTDFYWRSRRKAGQLGWRVLVVSLSLTLVSGIICVIIGVSGLITSRIAQVPTSLPDASPSIPAGTDESVTELPTQTVEPSIESTGKATLEPTSEIIAVNTATQTATETATTAPTDTSIPSTATRKPTVTKASTATPTITLTPSETYLPAVPVLTLTIESSVTPNADATLNITALAVQISSDLEPLEPAETFDAGFKRVYYFVAFEQMQPGVLWRRQLLHSGEALDQMSYTWGLEREGSTYFFFGREEGFQPGEYEIRLYIGNSSSPAASAKFNVK